MADAAEAAEQVTQHKIEELRQVAAAALKEWFEAGIAAGGNPMMMAGQLMQDVERMLG